MVKIRTKKCPNCKLVFTNRAEEILFTPAIKCYSCVACGAILNKKRCVFAVDLAPIPVIRNLLNMHQRIKALANYQKWVEAFVELYAENPSLPRVFGTLDLNPLIDTSIALENKIQICTQIDNLNREYRLRSFRISGGSGGSGKKAAQSSAADDDDDDDGEDEAGDVPATNEMLTQMKFMEEHKIFSLIKKYRRTSSSVAFITEKLRADETYLTRITSASEEFKLLDSKLGHYSGTAGNAAKKASTRIWRALRFLEACNKIVSTYYPKTLHIIDLNFNRNTNVATMFDMVKLESSKPNVRKLFAAAQSSQAQNECQVALDRFFYIRMARKESRYNTPTNPANKKQIFLSDYGDVNAAKDQSSGGRAFKTCTLAHKDFDYIVIMNLQSKDKMTKMRENKNSALIKMGEEIWLANVYALNTKKLNAATQEPKKRAKRVNRVSGVKRIRASQKEF